MNILIMHCYSDSNKGDAAIIKSTIDLFKDKFKDANITLMSTFAHNDIRILSEHRFTYNKNEGVDLIPSIFPEPFIKKDNNEQPKLLKKVISFLKSFVKINLLLLLPKGSYKLILNKTEQKIFEGMINKDLVISKGGSFLYSFKGIQGDLFFLRLIYPFLIFKKYNIKTIIFSQSLGPIENKVSRFFAKKVFNSIDYIMLREKVCINLLEKFGVDKNKITVIPDAAFALKNVENHQNLRLIIDENNIKKNEKNIGITVRGYQNATILKKYLDEIMKYINYLLKENYNVFLFPQVIGPDEDTNDLVYMKRIKENIKSEKLTLVSKDYSPEQLRELYGVMSYFVGTRLHSCIFAMTKNIPTIAISYHGTKTYGIMEMLGMKDYVLDINTITSDKLITTFKQLVTDENEIKMNLDRNLSEICKKLQTVMDALEQYLNI